MIRLFIAGALMATLAIVSSVPASSQAQTYDPTVDWGIESGFSITVDSEGFDLPTAIAVVPQPGDGPEEPIYFVTELEGTVKVVTNSRSVHTFAESFFELKPSADLPATGGEVGLAGICLDPERGYVFVTFAYDDAGGILRNNVVRFETQPKTFSIKPEGQLAFTDVFSGDESAASHQIGPCQVEGDSLFVAVGDGEKPAFSQIIDSTLGKVIRMTVDGDPVRENPFYEDQNARNASNYVWAKGLRNPFALKTVNGRVFVGDNGPSLDRFLEAQAGDNFLWDGSNASIGANASLLLFPSIGLVQMDRYPAGSPLFPERYSQSFFLTRSGNLPWTTRADARQPPDIITIKYSLASKMILATPERFLRYQGSQDQMLVGLAFGPTGLYFVPLYPDERGVSSVFRVTYEPGQVGTLTVGALDMMGLKGCFACHSLKGTGGSSGPPLDRDALVTRIRARLDSPGYRENMDQLDLLDREPFASFKQARKEVLNSEDLKQIRTWLEYRIQEPRFDDAKATMPNLEVSRREAELIAGLLLTPVESVGFIEELRERGGSLLPRPRKRHMLYFLAWDFC